MMAVKPAPRAKPPEFEALMEEACRDVDASRLVVTLARADDALSRRIEEALAPIGVTGPKFNVLMELAASPDGRLSLSEVARRLLKSPPNVTALMDRLESDGWVRRIRDASDRRVVTAEITKEGWSILRRAAPLVFAMEKQLLSCLSKTRRKELARLLDSLAAEASEASATT
jgi:MarR family 2-MHQ and catechol resistance regulon transcriptional repressor